MKTRIVILPTGILRVFIEEGTFEEGKAKIEKLLRDLRAKGLEVELDGDVEAHRHGDEKVGQREGVSNRGID